MLAHRAQVLQAAGHALERSVRRRGVRRRLSSAGIVVLLAVGALVAGLILIVQGHSPASLFRLDASEASLPLVAITLVTATVAAFAILTSIQLLGAAKSSVLEISYPLFVAVFSCLFFGGQLQLPVVIGGGFIFVGAAIIALAK